MNQDLFDNSKDAPGWNINVQPQTPPKPQKPQQKAPQQKALQQPVQQVKSAPVQTFLGDLRNVQFGKYLWRVLDVRNDRALLLTEEILKWREYHSSNTSVTWETCELRRYLNEAFLKTFSAQERKRIVQTENRNADNPWFGTSGGRDTVDKVFLLSIEEVVKYFGDSGQLQERPDEYWIDDKYNSVRKAEYRSKTGWWWLRSPGGNDVSNSADVFDDGSLSMFGSKVDLLGGVSPALWLNL